MIILKGRKGNLLIGGTKDEVSSINQIIHFYNTYYRQDEHNNIQTEKKRKDSRS